MTPQELIAAITGAQADEPAKLEMPIKEAQRNELTIIREQMTDRERPEKFTQWEEVTYAHRTGSITADAMSRAVFVFWQYITADEAFRRLTLLGINGAVAAVFAASPDCLIAWLSRDGLRFEVADSSLLVNVKLEGDVA